MINIIKDKRGILSAIEFIKLPFKPKRVFLLHGLKASRGGHYHKKCKQYLFIVSGKCTISLEDKKTNKNTTLIVTAGEQVYLPCYTKIVIKNPSKDCIICVLCNKKYDPTDVYYD